MNDSQPVVHSHILLRAIMDPSHITLGIRI